MKKIVAHLDADCFYVSCERVRDLALRHVPSGVLGNQGACVIAKSYEAKALGVKTGMPIWEAVKCCPDGVYLKRDFRWYEVLSRQLLNLLRTVSPAVEYYSIDEMFFDAGELPSVFSRPLHEASVALQHRVLHEIGIPVSMGVSWTKTLAKLVSDTAKPFGCRVLLEENDIQEFLRTHPVQEISGIGERSRIKLAAHGIKTCLEFSQADRNLIRKLLTIKGEGMWWELHGTLIHPVLTKRPKHKCIGRGGSLGESTTDLERLTAWVVRNVERLIEELDFHEVLTERVSFAVEFKEGGGWCGRALFMEPTASFQDITAAAKGLLVEACRLEKRITGMHLLAEQLSDRHLVQMSLFPNIEPPRADPVADVKRSINARIGRFAVRSGETLPLADIYADEANDFDICDVRGKICF
jgi:nucleotidyltransferase/DNA polymerase involved in DNA repair